jgi:hypothetical protein
MAAERCEKCGALIALVGRIHNCRPRPEAPAGTKSKLTKPCETKPETKPPETKPSPKGGRPKGEQPWVKLGISRAAWYRQQRG